QYTYRIYGVNAENVESSSYATVSKYTKIESPTGGSFGTVTSTSIDVSATGTLSNLTSGTSGLYFENTTVSANSGWAQTNSWSNGSLSANTQYTYQATSRNGDSVANTAAAMGSKYTLADNPVSITASDGTYADKVSLSWTSVGSASGYKVYRDGIAGVGTEIYNGVGLAYDDTAASSSHTYYLYTKNNENALSSNYVTDTGSLMTVPATPTIGAASALSTTSIRWAFTDNASNEDGFKIHNAAHSTVASNATADLSYVDETGLSANTQYTRHAHTYNGAGDSSASANASKYTLSATPSVSADKTTSTWYNTTDVIFTNAASFGAAGVQYYRYVFNQNATHTFTDAETQWSAGTLTRTASANGSWYLHVKAFNGDDVANGTQTYGPFYYDGSAPTDPSGLGLTAASVSQINLSWTGSTDTGGSNLIGYKIERAPDNSGSPGTFAQIDTDTASPYTDIGRVANTKYWYR
ncbi:hypothetical protein LCGC14_2592240, partial [marine sediment metagenome]